MRSSFARVVLSLCLTFLLVCPAWATGPSTISDLKEQIKKLLLVESDPDTPAEVRALNRTFLAERRAQLRDALQTRIAALRKYQTAVGTSLSAIENQTVAASIRELERDLTGLEDAARPSAPPSAQPRSAATTRGRPRTVPAVLKASSPADTTAAPAAEESGTEPAAPPPAAAAAAAAQDKLVVTAPLDGQTTILERIEVYVEIKEPRISLVEVVVKDKDDKQVGKTQTIEYDRDEGLVDKVPVNLALGENKITVTNASKKFKDAISKTIKVTREAEATAGAGGGGGAGAGAAGAAPAAPTTSNDVKSPAISPPKEDETSIRGTVTTTEADAEVEIEIDGAKMDTKARVLEGNKFIYTNPRLTLRRGQVIAARLVEGDKASRFSETTVVADGETRHPLRGFPTGLVFGGAVMSQQAEEFQQTDPFFGFIAGYRFPGLKQKRVYNATKLSDGTYVDNVTGKQCWMKTGVGVTKSDLCPVELTSTGQERMTYLGRFHLRFQGIFQASPRAATPEGGCDHDADARARRSDRLQAVHLVPQDLRHGGSRLVRFPDH